MAGETKPEKPAVEVVKNMKVDTLASKDGTVSDATSCISSGDGTSSIKGSDVDQEALMSEQGIYYPVSYYSYYYPEWDDQGYFSGADGLELQQPAFQADNGSVFYYLPGLPNYNTYSPFVPGAVVDVDGQYFGQQAYIPSPMYPQPLLSPGYFPASVAYGTEVVPAYTWDYGDGVHGNGFIGDSTIAVPKNSFSPQGHSMSHMKPIQSSKVDTPVTKAIPPAKEVPPIPAARNQSVKSVNKTAAVLSKSYFPITKFPSYPNQGKGGLPYPASTINVKENGQGWIGNEKLKQRIKSSGDGDLDMLNEQNRGPRTNNSQNTWVSGVDSAGDPSAQDDDKTRGSTDVINRKDYNLLDFPTEYDHAMFFVIKSYSEDDVHKCIKYNVWASTPNGNKRLDNAFQLVREKMEEKGSKCPVFLFFSVNASGQFCGVAEMIGRVDFNENMDFWQQDKWNGFFPVKWHIIKDVPNPQFRHIILENNDNKPVTNSRDTQEVKLPQGMEMLKIFKNFSSKTCILDDFGFYEHRQKAMQDKRIKLPTQLEQLPPKMGDEAPVKKADDLKSIVSGLQAIDLAVAKKADEPEVGI